MQNPALRERTEYEHGLRILVCNDKKYDRNSHVSKVKRHRAIQVWLVHWQNGIGARSYDPI
jgi:hypothetical protein